MIARWPQVRAGLIACAIFLGLVEGCPIPPPHETLPWQQGYVGVIRPMQHAIMTPLAWLPKWLRVSERFALFQAAEPDRFRLAITARTRDGHERLVFRAGDDAANGDDATLVQRRVRGVWNPAKGPTSQWMPFAQWFANRVFEADASVDLVTLRFERVHIEDGVPHDTGAFAFDITRTRGQR